MGPSRLGSRGIKATKTSVANPQARKPDSSSLRSAVNSTVASQAWLAQLPLSFFWRWPFKVRSAPMPSADSSQDVLLVFLANFSQYGLSSTVWTSDLRRAHRVAAALESGIVWVNTWMLRDLRTPFGGVKNSGLGREGGADAMRFFTEAKNVVIRY